MLSVEIMAKIKANRECGCFETPCLETLQETLIENDHKLKQK